MFERYLGATANDAAGGLSEIEKLATSCLPKLASKELADRIKLLQSLYQKGLVTSEEFSTKKNC